MASEKIAAMIEEVKTLSVLELAELVHALEEEFDLALIGTKGKWYDHKVTVSVMLLRPSRADDKETPSVTTRGEEILARLEKGENFADLARLYSADSHAKDGGVWKDVKPEEAFRPEIAETIAKLKVGEFSTLVNLDGWGFIVRKDAETLGKQMSFSEAYDQIERNVKSEQAKAEYDAWMKRLREQAFVKIYPMPDDAK